jgi:two-component system chemotaxis sensor kinase CheA
VFDRFPRQVRDIARDLGKEVQFSCEGREVELDRSLLDAIGEPIVHLLRNALDHGIEDSAARVLAGKPATGQLVLRAGRDRSSVVIQVEDDGRGIDRDAIRLRAQAQGIVDANAATLTDDELLQVLAHPGFSTASAVTSISGRGVGVDVVMTRVRALGGTLDLETVQGEGSAFTIRLPVTLAIIRALLVRVDSASYAIPAAHVVEVLEYTPGTIVTSAAGERLPWRDELLPIVRLRERFGLPCASDETFVAVVESAGRRSALFVDALLSQHDIVVKPLDVARGSLALFNGATVLGDGTPSLIVDVGSLC